YPLCCIRQFIYRKGSQKSFIYTSTRFQNDPERGRYIMDYKLNILANIPLIFHMPCTPDCTASRILAGKVLKLYHDYSPVFIKQIVRFLRQPALVFNTENYVRLNGKFAGNKIRYCGIEHVHYPYFADGNKRFENIRINQLVKTLSKGNILVFDAVAFSILDNKDLLVTVEYRNFPFQVYDFR
ncbi:MAG: hypothetical protein NC923_02535, partial [Candidatus Omnitrophica bacterium]|nr:hypothetical protein [Candidatus Omnitrophota bacterium]